MVVERTLHADRQTEKMKTEDPLQGSTARSLGGSVQQYYKMVCSLPKFDLYFIHIKNFFSCDYVYSKNEFDLRLCLVFIE